MGLVLIGTIRRFQRIELVGKNAGRIQGQIFHAYRLLNYYQCPIGRMDLDYFTKN
jgi:hypothetical protein